MGRLHRTFSSNRITPQHTVKNVETPGDNRNCSNNSYPTPNVDTSKPNTNSCPRPCPIPHVDASNSIDNSGQTHDVNASNAIDNRRRIKATMDDGILDRLQRLLSKRTPWQDRSVVLLPGLAPRFSHSTRMMRTQQPKW